MVHYIRFLRTPYSDISKKTIEVSAVVAIQTDLSDALLSQDIALVAAIVEANAPQRTLHVQSLQWQATSRALKFIIQCPGRYAAQSVRLHLSPKPTELVSQRRDIPEVLDIWSDAFLLSDKQRSEPIVERRIQLVNKTRVRIWEETGESIARHIWDASLGFLIYFAQSLSPSPPSGTTMLPALVNSSKVRRLRVLELGAGCGIVGIAFAQLFKCDVYLTDLEDAQEILAQNCRGSSPMAGSTIHAGVLDWASGLEGSSNSTFDLVLVSDCIYNPDSSLHLVEILRQLALRAPDILVLVGFKRRHEADTIFFERMQQTDFNVVETINLPLPHIATDYDPETPTAEFYMYKHHRVPQTKG